MLQFPLTQASFEENKPTLQVHCGPVLVGLQFGCSVTQMEQCPSSLYPASTPLVSNEYAAPKASIRAKVVNEFFKVFIAWFFRLI